MTTKRIIAVAAGISVNPYDTPQADAVQGLVGWDFSPPITEIVQRGVAPSFIPIVWDALVTSGFGTSGYLVLYDATLNDDGTFTVTTDFFSLFIGPAPHTYAGWEIPGAPEVAPLPGP